MSSNFFPFIELVENETALLNKENTFLMLVSYNLMKKCSCEKFLFLDGIFSKIYLKDSKYFL